MDGVDVSEDAIKYGKEKYPDISTRLFVIKEGLGTIEDESYDVITMFDVIEHIPDVGLYMHNEVFRILKNEGLLIFQTPNIRLILYLKL